jgi:hypothetical protein
MTATTIDPPNSCLEHELLFYLSQFSLSDGSHSIQNDRSIVVVADGKARSARVNDFETPTDRNLVSHRVKEPGKVGSNSIRKKIVGHI